MIALGRRSLMALLRQPAAVIPTVLFPLLFLGLTSSGARAAALVPGFPARAYVDFLLGGSVVQGAIFGGMNAATNLAYDVESGFLNRLAMTPISRASLLLGPMAGAFVLSAVQSVLILGLGLAIGADFAAGLAGVPIWIIGAMSVSVGFSAVTSILGLRAGSGEAVQGAFPLFFVMVTFSSFFFPRDLIQVEWFKVVATFNPTSYLIEGMRSLVLDGIVLDKIVGFLIAATGITAAGLFGANAALSKRLTRT